MLERFIEDYSEDAFQFAFHLCGGVEEAKELVQEAFYRVISRWESFDQAQSLETWFCAILKNIYHDGLRKFDKRNFVSLDMPLVADRDSGASYADTIADKREDDLLGRLERQEFSAEVRKALRSLSKDHRAMIVLSDVQGLTYEEIASVLDASLNTVRSRLCRARKAFRKALIERSLGEAEEGVKELVQAQEVMPE